MAIDLTKELFNAEATANVNDVETAASSNGELPPGKYHVRLDGVQNKEAGELNVTEFTFVIASGAFKGRKVRYQLWLGTKETDKDGNPKPADKLAEDTKRIKNEFWHAAGVLGLATKTADGKSYAIAKGKSDFKDCLNAEAVVETTLRAYKDAQGNDKKSSEVKMFGLYATNDPKVAAIVKGGGSVTVPSTSSGSVTAPKRDLKDLV